jgi:hypothetical protein
LASASLPAKSGWAVNTPSLASSDADRNMHVRALCAPPAVSCAGPNSRSNARSAIQAECSNIPARGNKIRTAHLRRFGVCFWRMCSGPVLGNLKSRCEPDIREPARIIQKSLWCHHPTGTSYEATMQPDRQHLWGILFIFIIQRIEAVFEIGKRADPRR